MKKITQYLYLPGSTYLLTRSIISYFTLIKCIDCSLKITCTAVAKLRCIDLPAINVISQMSLGEPVHSHYVLIMQSPVFSYEEEKTVTFWSDLLSCF